MESNIQNKDLNSFDIHWMKKALSLAKQSYDDGEVPVGAIVIIDNSIIGEGRNLSITSCDPTAHAEMTALRSAALYKKNYRLPNATLYSTIEPCTMCIGAIIHARISRLVYGALEPRAGAVLSCINLPNLPHYNHKFQVEGGVMAEESKKLIKDFFKAKRSLG